MSFAICLCDACAIVHLQARIENDKDQLFSLREKLVKITANLSERTNATEVRLAAHFHELMALGTHLTGGQRPAENSRQAVEARARIESIWSAINLLEQELEVDRAVLVNAQVRLGRLVRLWEQDIVDDTRALRDAQLVYAGL